jgi:hypothetical protein
VAAVCPRLKTILGSVLLGLHELAGSLLLRTCDSARWKAEHPLNCPKSNEAMEKVVFESVEVDRCTGCFGIWFDAGEFKDFKKRTLLGFLKDLFAKPETG